MKSITSPKALTAAFAVFLVGAAMGISAAVDADGGVALIALIVACLVGGVLFARTLDVR